MTHPAESDTTGAVKTCRLLVHHAGDGSWNMAVDELLLEQANASGQAALRIYRWSEPTLSLGYFQPHGDREAHQPSRGCALVRRRSGGGAILHDHELTYALAVPTVGRWSASAETLYRTVHMAVVGMLRGYGCAAQLYEAAPLDTAFLCFHRRTRGDLVCDQDKIMGSAQRRSKAALLQHGSLLLQRSPCAPSLPGLLDLIHDPVSIEELEATFASQILSALRYEPIRSELSSAEQKRAAAISCQRFSADTWTLRR